MKLKKKSIDLGINKMDGFGQLSASLRCFRTRTTGGYVALTEPKFAYGKLHISPIRYMQIEIKAKYA